MGHPSLQGQHAGEFRPDLAVITSSLDRVWQVLQPDHQKYDWFWGAWQFQEEWDWRRFAWFWETQLDLWPRNGRRATEIGLRARYAAVWMQDGYSKAQIEDALGYNPMRGPDSLWTSATAYAAWLKDGPRHVRPGGLGGVLILEDMFAAGADPSQVEETRRRVRRTYRAPRVVTAEEARQSPFGWPEHISARLLYSETELGAIDQAKQRLRAQEPHHGAERHAA